MPAIFLGSGVGVET